MAKKRRPGAGARAPAGGMELAAAPAAGVPAAAVSPVPAAAVLPRETAADGGAVAVLALTAFLAPALGVPGEEMLQDTLKSAIVAFGALVAAGLFLFAQRGRREPLRWHGVLWLPLMLMAYALGSMAWSHTYLAGVEAIRWFLFALLAWLGLNTLTRERLPALAWAFHGGALVASFWALLQFWGGMTLFPQGPQPASTFINRNFFAEFAVCTLPFSALLLARARQSSTIALLSLSNALVVTALLMTGTRSALMALWLQVLVVLPLIAWRCRAQLPCVAWPRGFKLLAAGVLAGTVLGLGVIPTDNPKVLEEGHGATPLARAFVRTQSIGPGDYSLGIRMIMWRDTLRLVRARPLAGVGAGAWESEIPRYQQEGAQLETDYYVHNEFLQLVAEYGLVGWAFLLLLAAWLLAAAWRSWRARGPEADADRPWRAIALASLLVLMVVSNIGFPWRMAATGALFALCLGVLAASDARLGARGVLARPLPWSPLASRAALAAAAAGLLLAVYITQQAAAAEQKLVRATRIALSITNAGDWNNPRWRPMKQEMLQLVREGVAINPHYRKITPIVADELARWGDWTDATWIWESVLASRPYVVAILSNAARGYASTGQPEKAREYLERAQRIQPNAPAVRSLEVILLARTGHEREALERAKAAYAAGIVDYDLVNGLYLLALNAGDYALAQEALQRRTTQWPQSRARGMVQLGLLYAQKLNQPAKALEAFRDGLAAATPGERAALLPGIPPEYRQRLGAAPAAPVPQTSASSR